MYLRLSRDDSDTIFTTLSPFIANEGPDMHGNFDTTILSGSRRRRRRRRRRRFHGEESGKILKRKKKSKKKRVKEESYLQKETVLIS